MGTRSITVLDTSRTNSCPPASFPCTCPVPIPGRSPAPPADHRFELGEGEGLDLDALVLVALRLGGREAGRAEHVHGLVAESRRRKEERDPAQAPRLLSDLFLQLPLRGLLRRLAGVQAAGGQLPEGVVDGIAVLADEDDPPVILDREDGDGAGMPHDLARRADAAGLLDLVEVEGKDLARIDAARRKAASAAGHAPSVPRGPRCRGG